ncbi:transcription cofactor HES-6 [Erinaceus europaeus]|uniref:Transcription cofactor HES-6 n=1 Tax=Erinaceus europaeus TaxID=9365 RepID=A0ABM3XL79_ERIEU|nr:transcription cofactor HES-6 [Erinaceus europaeus]
MGALICKRAAIKGRAGWRAPRCAAGAAVRLVMAAPRLPGGGRAALDWERGGARGDRKARKPLVEKKRRARINQSLRELRLLLAGAEARGGPGPHVPAKLENAEVLELTVRRVQGALRGRARERQQLQAQASERFAAGYIRCMHEVHTFVSACQALDAAVAAPLLKHLLRSMPLRGGGRFRHLLPGRGHRTPPPRDPDDDPSSEAEEAPEAEPSRPPAEGQDSVPAARTARGVWRPW